MAQYREKPVVIEAMQYPGHGIVDLVDSILAFEEWLEPLAKAAGRWPLRYKGQLLIIPTLEDEYEAQPGDWIIRGEEGEIYCCPPDIFAATYDPVDDTTAQPPGSTGG
jgi:hypothetical protein